MGKKSIRSVSLFIVLSLLFLLTISCSGSKAELMPFNPEIDLNADFGGKDFKIVGLFREGIAEIAPESSDSLYSDMLLDHYEKISKTYNLNIIAEGSSTISDDFQLKSAVGDKFADIIDESLGTILNLYNGGLLVNVNDILDYSELRSGKYGSESQIESVTLKRKSGDVIIGFQAAYWGIPTPKFSNAGYMNPDFVELFNLKNPYELIENDEWTWAEFEKMCVNCESQGNDPSSNADDTYGVAEDPGLGYVTKSAMASNDAQFVSYNESTGLYDYSIDSEEFDETITWIKDLYAKGGLKVIDGETVISTIGYVVNDFIEGRAMFMFEHTYHGLNDRSSVSYKVDFDFSWIPFPKGPSAVNYNYGASVSSADRYFAIPAVGMNEDMLRTVIPKLFSQFDGLTEYEWKDYFSQGMFFNESSEKWFYHMSENLTNNYDYLLTFFTDSEYLEKIITGAKTQAEVLESYQRVGKQDVDEFLNNQ